MVLLDRRVVRVHRNGLSRTFAQRVVQVLTERGAEENKEFAVHYTPGREEVDIRQARVYRRNAARRARRCWRRPIAATRICRSPGTASTTTTAPRSSASRGCAPGDVVEIQYLVDDVGSDNQMADYFGDLQYIGETIPKRRWDYTLIAPAVASDPRQRAASCRGWTGRCRSRGERSRLPVRRQGRRQDRRRAGDAGRGRDRRPTCTSAPTRRWNDVGAWYWRLVEESLTARRRDPADGARAGQARHDRRRTRARHLRLRGQRAPATSASSSASTATSRTRSTQVLARALRRLQGQGGADGGAAARGGRRRPSWCWCARGAAATSTRSPASLAIFDHAIVYVPKLDRYLDGTAEFSGMARAAGAGPGRGGAAGRAARQRADRDAGAAVEREPRRRRWQVALEASRRRARRRGAGHPRAGGAQLARALPDRGRAQGSLRPGLERPLPGRAARFGRRCRRSRIATRP